MFTQLNRDVIGLLCCPLCKGDLINEQDKFVCEDCATQYPLKNTPVGDHIEKIYDFRIHRPTYCIPETTKMWEESQKHYKEFHENLIVHDSLEVYIDEIDSVREIYTQEFRIEGTVLDVGGHQGRLRHYLSDQEVPLYVSVDPYLNIFENIQHQPNLLRAFPSLLRPCNFMACHAEDLAFKSNSFDWVHMRSVIDHFADPYIALKEAYRVLKPNGRIMIGLTICPSIKTRIGKNKIENGGSLRTRIISRISEEGILSVLKRIPGRLTDLLRVENGIKQEEGDDHRFRLSCEELVDLLLITGFKIEKEHWQKPPYTYVIYLSAISTKSGT